MTELTCFVVTHSCVGNMMDDVHTLTWNKKEKWYILDFCGFRIFVVQDFICWDTTLRQMVTNLGDKDSNRRNLLPIQWRSAIGIYQNGNSISTCVLQWYSYSMYSFSLLWLCQTNEITNAHIFIPEKIFRWNSWTVIY